MRILGSLHALTVELQKKSSHILAVYERVSEVMLDLEPLKINCEEEFNLWYSENKNLADKMNISIATPRIAARQLDLSNTPADSPEA